MIKTWALIGLLLAAAASVRAHASIEPWLGGVLSYETVPPWELDMRGLGVAGAGAGAQAALETGLWSGASAWGQTGSGAGFSTWELGVRTRFSQAGEWPLDLGAYGRLRDAAGGALPRGGLIVAHELWDHSLSVNLEHGQEGASWAAGWRSPFLLPTMCLAVDARGVAEGLRDWIPQLGFYFPGDLSVQVGSRLASGLPPQILLSLSFLYFPTP